MSQISQPQALSPASPGIPAPPPAPKLASNPGKADAWLKYARREGNPADGSMTYWLSGIRENPFDVQATREFFAFADPRKGSFPSISRLEKDFVKSGGVLEEYISSLFRSALRPGESHPAAATVKVAAGAGITGVTELLAERALEIVRVSPEKPATKKDAYYAMALALADAKIFQLAWQAASAAKALFPNDIRLCELDRDLSSQAHMQKTGLDQGVKEGSFRGNIKDAERQAQLEQEGRLVPTQGVEERLLAAKARYEAAPTDSSAFSEYCKLLVQVGGDLNEETAIALLEKSAETSQTKLYRQQAAELRMRRMQRDIRKLQQEGALPEAVLLKEKEYLEYRKKEFKIRLTEEPANNTIKFEYGKVHFDLGEHRAAIEILQSIDGGQELGDKAQAIIVDAFLALDFSREAWSALKLSARYGKSTLAGQAGMLNSFAEKLSQRWIVSRDSAAKTVLQEVVGELLARNIKDPVGQDLRARLYQAQT